VRLSPHRHALAGHALAGFAHFPPWLVNVRLVWGDILRGWAAITAEINRIRTCLQPA
jgi:hypothetical protein